MTIIEKIGLLFRGIIIVLFIILLVIFYQYSANGRYTYRHSNDDIWMLDSRTGILYLMSINKKERCKIDLPSGNILFTPMESQDKTTSSK